MKFEADFIEAIKNNKKIIVTFYSKQDRTELKRECAPLDIGPSRKAKDKSDRYHMWDYESDTKMHVLSLLDEQVKNIEIIDEIFSPSDLITWDLSKSPWFIKRDWGKYS